LLGSDGNAVADRATQYLLHGVFVLSFQIQVAVFRISLKIAFPLQISGNPVADGTQPIASYHIRHFYMRHMILSFLS
jgi:hypothetical protein